MVDHLSPTTNSQSRRHPTVTRRKAKEDHSGFHGAAAIDKRDSDSQVNKKPARKLPKLVRDNDWLKRAREDYLLKKAARLAAAAIPEEADVSEISGQDKRDDVSTVSEEVPFIRQLATRIEPHLEHYGASVRDLPRLYGFKWAGPDPRKTCLGPRCPLRRQGLDDRVSTYCVACSDWSSIPAAVNYLCGWCQNNHQYAIYQSQAGAVHRRCCTEAVEKAKKDWEKDQKKK